MQSISVRILRELITSTYLRYMFFPRIYGIDPSGNLFSPNIMTEESNWCTSCLYHIYSQLGTHLKKNMTGFDFGWMLSRIYDKRFHLPNQVIKEYVAVMIELSCIASMLFPSNFAVLYYMQRLLRHLQSYKDFLLCNRV